MHRDGLASASITFSHCDEVSDDLVIWTGAIWELHLVDFDRVPGETTRLVQFSVQTKNSFDVQVEERVD